MTDDLTKRHLDYLRRKTADEAELWAANRIEQLEAERDELMAALVRAERKLSAYVGVCKGDKELTDAVLPMARAAIAKGESHES